MLLSKSFFNLGPEIKMHRTFLCRFAMILLFSIFIFNQCVVLPRNIHGKIMRNCFSHISARPTSLNLNFSLNARLAHQQSGPKSRSIPKKLHARQICREILLIMSYIMQKYFRSLVVPERPLN